MSMQGGLLKNNEVGNKAKRHERKYKPDRVRGQK